jgi:hypothetical protein
MEIQEAFNKIVDHAKLGVKSQDHLGMCRLRGRNGSMCFVGVLVDDSIYNVNLEMAPIDSWSKLLEIDLSFVSGMRKIHDGYQPEVWKKRLQTYATENGLQFNW